MRPLKYRADQDGELLAATRALPDSPRRDVAGAGLAIPEVVVLVVVAAVGADRTFGPADGFD